MLKVLEKIPKVFSHIYAILLILVGWVIFAFEDLGKIGTYLSTMFNINGTSFANPEAIYYLKNYIVIIIIGIICSIPLMVVWKKIKSAKNNKINDRKVEENEQLTKQQNEETSKESEIVTKKKVVTSIISSIGYVAIVILCTASLVNNSFNPFLYFRF